MFFFKLYRFERVFSAGHADKTTPTKRRTFAPVLLQYRHSSMCLVRTFAERGTLSKHPSTNHGGAAGMVQPCWQLTGLFVHVLHQDRESTNHAKQVPLNTSQTNTAHHHGSGSSAIHAQVVADHRPLTDMHVAVPWRTTAADSLRCVLQKTREV